MPDTPRGYVVPPATDVVSIDAVQALADSIDADVTIVAATATAANTVNTIVDAKGDIVSATAADTLARLPVGAAGTVLSPDSSAATGLAWVTPDTLGAATASKVGNLLADNVANATGTSNDTTGFTAAGATLASSAAYVDTGFTRSLQLTLTSTTGRATIGGSTTSGTIAIRPNVPYTFRARVLGPTDVQTVQARIYWFTSAGNVAASTASNSSASLATSASWQTVEVQATAPADAAYCSVGVYVAGGGVIGETRFESGHGLWAGNGGYHARPGNPIVGQTPADGSITSAKFAAGAVGAAALADGSITSAKFAAGAVGAAALADGSVTLAATSGLFPVNLLTESQAAFETLPDPAFTATNATPSVEAGSPYGGNLLRWTISGSGPVFYPTYQTAAEGETFTGSIRMDTLSPNGRLVMQFRDGTTVLESHTAYHSGSGMWEKLEVSAAAPADTDRVYVFVYLGQSNATVDVDQFGLWKGAGGTWSTGRIENTGVRVISGQAQIWDGTAWVSVSSGSSLPAIWLPADFSAVVGDTLQLFTRGMIEGQDPLTAPYRVTSARGSAYGRLWEYTPTTAETVTVTVGVDALGQTAETSTTVNVVATAPADPAAMTSIMCVGDSLTNGMVWPQETYRRLTQAGGSPAGHEFTNFQFIGDQAFDGFPTQAGFGNPGWKWGTYTNDEPTTANIVTVASHDKDDTDQKSVWRDDNAREWYLETIIGATSLRIVAVSQSGAALPASGGLTWKSGGVHKAPITYTSATLTAGTPFWNGTAMSFSSWITDESQPDPDMVITMLGWNGLAATGDPAGHDMTYVRTFWDTLHTDYPDCLGVMIGLQMPSPHGGLGVNYGADGTYHNYYRLTRYVAAYNAALAALAAESGYTSWLRYASLAAQFDADNNYPTLTADVNSRNTATETRQANGIHPADSGKYQIADVAYREIVRAFS